MKKTVVGLLFLVVGVMAGYALACLRLQRVHRAMWAPASEVSFTHNIESAHNYAAALALLKESKPEEAIKVLDSSLDHVLKSLAAGEIRVGSELHGIAAASVGPAWQRTMLEPAIEYRTKHPSESPGVNKFCTRMKQPVVELRSDLSASDFKSALVGRWKSVFVYEGRQNIQNLELTSGGHAAVVIAQADRLQSYSGPYTITFDREPNPDSVTFAAITIRPPESDEIVLSRVNFGLHNGININEGIVLRVDEDPRGVLKRAD